MHAPTRTSRETESLRRARLASASPPPVVFLALAIFLVASNLFAQPAVDQNSRIRSLVAAGDLDRARAAVDDWTARFPDDADARAWRARLLAWTNQWPEAEAAYRELLVRAPADVDLLAGLADVLSWQRRGRDALPLLDRAVTLDPRRADLRLRRARVLEQLGRQEEARAAYRETLALDPASHDAENALARLRPLGRYDLRVGSDLDRRRDAATGRAAAISLGVRWNESWSSVASVARTARFGETATRAGGEVTRRLGVASALTAGGAVASDQGIVPRGECQLEYSRAFLQRSRGWVRGVEASALQKWMWYRDADVGIFTPGAIIYLPRDWSWLVRVSASRLRVSGTGNRWRTAGWTRLTVPLRPAVDAFVMFALGTEDYGYRDQLFGLATHASGGGVRWRLARGQELSARGEREWRSDGRARTTVGASYGVRF